MQNIIWIFGRESFTAINSVKLLKSNYYLSHFYIYVTLSAILLFDPILTRFDSSLPSLSQKIRFLSCYLPMINFFELFYAFPFWNWNIYYNFLRFFTSRHPHWLQLFQIIPFIILFGQKFTKMIVAVR